MPPLFGIEGLRKRYAGQGRTEALRGVTLEIPESSCLALVGRNGSGKSTLALCLAGFEVPTEGKISHFGNPVWPGRWSPRPEVQLMRQDSPLTLNPRWPALDLIAEPLRIRHLPERIVYAQTMEVAAKVGLTDQDLKRVPGELSGGQRQRVALARALGVEFLELLIADEPLRGLDPPSVDSLLALLIGLQSDLGFSMLYISHDLRSVRHVADQVAVFSEGTVVECAPVVDFFAAPQHSASQVLLEAEL